MENPWLNRLKMMQICSQQMNFFKSSNLMEKINELLDVETEEDNQPTAETTDDPSLTESALEPPSPSSDLDGELHELLDIEKEEGNQPTAETAGDPSLTESTLESPSPSSDLDDELHELLDIEKEEGNQPTGETAGDPAQIMSVRELLQPSVSDHADEIMDLLKKAEKLEYQTTNVTEDTPQADVSVELLYPSQSDFMNNMNEFLAKEAANKIKPTGRTGSRSHNHEQGKVAILTKKSPFSIHVEIDDFLHAPICGDIVQNSFEFRDLKNKQPPHLDTKLLNTATYYPEQPDCRLVCSKIHEMIFLTDIQNSSAIHKNHHYNAILSSLHNSGLRSSEEINNYSSRSNDFIHIRVPVVNGEYKIELCLEESIVFDEEVLRIKEISKEVVLTNYKFVPTQFSKSFGNGICTAVKGNLFLEGYVHQQIEYTNAGFKSRKSVIPSNQLSQKMVLELIIHLLQVQQIRVSSDGKSLKGDLN